MIAPEPVTAFPLARLAAALLLGVVHAVAPYLQVLRGTPRSVWLSLPAECRSPTSSCTCGRSSPRGRPPSPARSATVGPTARCSTPSGTSI